LWAALKYASVSVLGASGTKGTFTAGDDEDDEDDAEDEDDDGALFTSISAAVPGMRAVSSSQVIRNPLSSGPCARSSSSGRSPHRV